MNNLNVTTVNGMARVGWSWLYLDEILNKYLCLEFDGKIVGKDFNDNEHALLHELELLISSEPTELILNAPMIEIIMELMTIVNRWEDCNGEYVV